MKKTIWFPAIYLLFICAGCTGSAQPPQSASSPNFTPQPSTPENSQTTIQGTLVEGYLPGSARRAEIEYLDGLGLDGTIITPPKVDISPGNHWVDIECQHEYETVPAEIILTFRADRGHHYSAQCEDKSGLINLGVKFWIEDETTGTIVSTGDKWAPGHDPNFQQRWAP